jgi:hypothetical protein
MPDPTTAKEGLALLAGTVRKNQPNNKELIDNVVRFYVRVISEPLNVAGSYVDMLLSDSFIEPPFEIDGTEIVPTELTSHEKSTRPRLIFMGKILRASNGLQPHIFLKDPCRLAYAGETDIEYIEKIISLHTLFVSQSGVYGVTPKFGDVVSVTLGVSDFQGPELKVASFSDVSSTQDSELYNYERDVPCTTLKSIVFTGKPLGGSGMAAGSLVSSYHRYESQRGSIVDNSRDPAKNRKVTKPNYQPVLDTLAPDAKRPFEQFLDNITFTKDMKYTLYGGGTTAVADFDAGLREHEEAFDPLTFEPVPSSPSSLALDLLEEPGGASSGRAAALKDIEATLAARGAKTKAPDSIVASQPVYIPKYIPYINSGRRSVLHQLKLYTTDGMDAAKPCNSDHHYGYALDLKFYIPDLLWSGDLKTESGLEFVKRTGGYLCRTDCAELLASDQELHLKAYKEIATFALSYGVHWYGTDAGADWTKDPVHWFVPSKGAEKKLKTACKEYYYKNHGGLYDSDPDLWPSLSIAEDIRWPIETGTPDD